MACTRRYIYDAEVGSDPIFIGSNVGDTVHFRKSPVLGIRTEGNNRLDSIVFKGGELLTELESAFLHSGYLIISSPDIRDNNQNLYTHTLVISDADGNYTWSESRKLLRWLFPGNVSTASPVYSGWIMTWFL